MVSAARRLVVEALAHFVLHGPAAGDQLQEATTSLSGKTDSSVTMRCRNAGSFSAQSCSAQGLSAISAHAGLNRNGCIVPRHAMTIRCAKRDLRDDVRALRVLRRHRLDLLFKGQFLGDRLQRRECHRHAGFAAELAHPLELVPFALEIGGHFKDAVAHAAHSAADADKLVLGRRRAGTSTPSTDL